MQITLKLNKDEIHKLVKTCPSGKLPCPKCSLSKKCKGKRKNKTSYIIGTLCEITCGGFRKVKKEAK